jgi:hypothetical protein
VQTRLDDHADDPNEVVVVIGHGNEVVHLLAERLSAPTGAIQRKMK